MPKKYINLFVFLLSCWKDSIQIDMYKIAYLHCHQQQVDSSSNVILVAKDGVQYPPILFDNSNHLKQFLTCVENGLAPNYKVDPPMWEDTIDSTNFSIVLKIDVMFTSDQNDEDLTTYPHHHRGHSTNYFELSPIGIGNDFDQNKKTFLFNSSDFETNNSIKNR